MHLWNNTFKPKGGSPYIPQVQITGIYASYCQIELSLLTSRQKIQAYEHVCEIQSLLNSFSTHQKSLHQNALIRMLHQLVHDCLHVRFCISDKSAQFQLFRKCDFENSTVPIQFELANAICNYTIQSIGIERKGCNDLCAWSNTNSKFAETRQFCNNMHQKQLCKRKHTNNDTHVSNKKHHA